MARISRSLAQSDYAALAAFRAALRTFLEFSAAAARLAGLAPQQHQAMLAVKGAGAGAGLTVGALATHLRLRPHSAVGLVDRLARHGLVRRERSADDRREVRVRLTARGERRLAGLAAAHREELRRLAPALRSLLADLGPPNRSPATAAGAADPAGARTRKPESGPCAGRGYCRRS